MLVGVKPIVFFDCDWNGLFFEAEKLVCASTIALGVHHQFHPVDLIEKRRFVAQVAAVTSYRIEQDLVPVALGLEESVTRIAVRP